MVALLGLLLGVSNARLCRIVAGILQELAKSVRRTLWCRWCLATVVVSVECILVSIVGLSLTILDVLYIHPTGQCADHHG
ncbi:hypothetical protein D7S89_06490 [Trinickia fusca]|uniref:Uncharacterized protein n=1 Tax=Trinickia fusca TaxID=2419777 RepID=A0A494XJI0_9BURK|nr:hypothetical protein D7S89_06490 [Trinickia fusca]